MLIDEKEPFFGALDRRESTVLVQIIRKRLQKDISYREKTYEGGLEVNLDKLNRSRRLKHLARRRACKMLESYLKVTLK